MKKAHWKPDIASGCALHRFVFQFCVLPRFGGSITWYVQVLCLILVLRIGETSHPGPSAGQFCLGSFNPSGLVGKANIVTHEMGYGDVWLVSETHLNHRAMNAFRSGLHSSRSPFKYCVGGHPVPSCADSMFSGTWKGVACLSKHPTRAFRHNGRLFSIDPVGCRPLPLCSMICGSPKAFCMVNLKVQTIQTIDPTMMFCSRR